MVLLLSGLGGCGGDASSGGGGIEIGGASGMGGCAGAPDMGNGGTLPPNHRAPLIRADGSLVVLPEGECVWAVCTDEVSGLVQRTGTCTPTGVGYLSLSCEDYMGYYEIPASTWSTRGPKKHTS